MIGGGLSGMTAALEAAKAGSQIDLVEKTDRLGGYILELHKLPPGSPPFENPRVNDIHELVSIIIM